MKVPTDNPEISEHQKTFKTQLENFPYLKPYWDFEKRDFDKKLLKASEGKFSHGEMIMARFMAGVWPGENILEFDYFEAVQILDTKHILFITDYGQNPIRP